MVGNRRLLKFLLASVVIRAGAKRVRVRLLPAVAAVGFALAVVLITGSALLNDRYGAAIRDSVITAGVQRDLLMDLIELEDQLADAMSGVRGYLLSGHRDYLDTYLAASASSAALLAKINGQERLREPSTARIVTQARTQLDKLQDIVAKARAGQREAAMAEAGPDLGRAAKVALEAEIHARRAELSASVLARRVTLQGQFDDIRRFNWLAALATVVILMGFGALLVRYFRQREDAADAAARLNATLEETVRRRTAELADLSQHLLSLREEERAALARDIHDEIGSELAALRLDCARLESAGTGHNPLAQTTWPRIRKALSDLTLAHRRIINSLHPTVLDHLGLEAAIRELLKDRLDGAALAYELSVDGSMEDLPPGVAIAAYRIVQEAVSNVLKHARASHVSVLLRRNASVLRVQITDDGLGLGTRSAEKGRMGLVGMRERTHKLGGSFHVGSGPSNVGTRVTARFPAAPALTQAQA